MIDAVEFRARTASLAAAIPAGGNVVNLCSGRYRFAAAFCAALARAATTLLPSSHSAGAVAELVAANPGCTVIDDADFDDAGPADQIDARPHAPEFTAAIGHTSGSTGVPSAHPKRWSGLQASTALNAAAIRDALGRSFPDARPWIVATVPPQHMYGLEISILLPLLAGFGIHCGKPLLPADVGIALSEVPPPRVLVSTPVHLRALVDSAVSFPEVAIVVSATAPLPRELARRIETRLGAVLIEFFGSTETCVIATRRTAREDWWRTYSGVRLQPGRSGTNVSAPWLTGDQHLHDIVEIRDDGSFAIIGRGSDIIEVAGKRASLADLTWRLQSLDGVEDAVVFQPPVREDGVAGRCAALVVAPGLRPRELARRMRSVVDAVFVPRPIIIVPKLPRNEVGKLPRERLLELLATAASRPRRGR
jgi:acyl-coenzyme A synthetase/AMP-(fatty) acid ligase